MTNAELKNVTFDNKVLLEQLRFIESSKPLSEEAISASPPGQSFENHLLHRAQKLAQQHHLSEATDHASGIVRACTVAAILFALMLGAGATLTAVAGGSTINIYWLLLVLVGFNCLSMALWLVGVTVRLDSLVSGSLSKVAAWLPMLLSRADSTNASADRGWLACHFEGNVGKWRASLVTQQLWLAYLAAGLATLIIVLLARQFDFVWGTTLLSDASFVNLTSTLSKPLQAVGFSAPSAQQVIETRIGAGVALTAEHRYNWGQFLIGALLLCGLLPRVLLGLISKFLLSRSQEEFALDYYLPYYVHLRQQLMPMRGESQIVDADVQTASTSSENAGAASKDNPLSGQMPSSVYWVAIELDSEVAWPPTQIAQEKTVGQVVDRASLQIVLEKLRAENCTELAIAVTANRAPDRGLKRSINTLSDEVTLSWLVLLQPPGNEPVTDNRLGAWYAVARECNIAAENVVTHAGEPA